MARFVVTGGAGFIGSHLVEHLLHEKQDVVVVDNFSTGREENLHDFRDQIILHQVDLTDLQSIRTAVEGADYIFHQGALPSVPRSVKNPLESHETNTTGTLNILIAAKDVGIKRLIYAASSSAYGDTIERYKNESMIPNPISPYGATKLAGEQYCKAFYETYGVETVSLRYFNVFGPRQNPHSAYTGVMAIFIPLMLQDKQPTIFGDGSATRDFTYIKNNVHANMLALHAKDAPGESINIASGESQSILDIIQVINKLLGKSIEPIFSPPRQGDIRHSLASLDKARTVLNYQPVVTFEEGVAETIEWYRRELHL